MFQFNSISYNNSLINYHKLIVSDKCSKCQNNIEKSWCHPCNAKRFQNEFGKWTSENREIDELIQQIQLNANKYQEIIEWIPFERLENVAYLAKGGFGTAYKANWLDGFIYSHKNQKKKWYEFGKQVVWNSKCSKCQNNIEKSWCHPCNAKRFQNEFGKWTSENREIDELIQQIQLNANKYQEIIEWIPFGRLENVAYLAKGGFGTAYKANWLDGFIYSHKNQKKKWYEFGKQVKQVVWNRYGKKNVCLKSLSNLTDNIDFLQEIKNQLKLRGKNAIAIYGITKNPTENEYMMVMDYAEYGSLRNLLNDNFKRLTWRRKYNILSSIVIGLTNIHEMGLMHKDFHSGNIVNQTLTLSFITDFGLCKPVTENNPENIYGVIPYMAPETLSRGEYTQASDIYSFGMVMLEILTSYQPYYNIPHDATLAKDICEGLNPEIKCEIPKFLKEIMEKCWNFEPLNRPTAKELKSQLKSYNDNKDNETGKQVNKQINDANKSNKNSIQYDPNEMHPEAIYTSRHLPFVKSKKFEAHNTKQYDFVIPDDIIEEVEENEIQEN
ncbi:hypothetical protein Glove_91g115 [Diversispora epigaea]|uniref:Protein kinase domain-containing protein n=1 Tax=Diversispora epigaea TaxID=1348612 RepID=A0A397J648_9GLOM|nr:hypothetical protein Glove_91g115 [Diversispora epigaea]